MKVKCPQPKNYCSDCPECSHREVHEHGPNCSIGCGCVCLPVERYEDVDIAWNSDFQGETTIDVNNPPKEVHFISGEKIFFYELKKVEKREVKNA
jgi:hypothetical protein